MRRLEELLHSHRHHGEVGGAATEASNRGWAADLELVNADNPHSKNRFFAREIEVSAAEFEECRQLYEALLAQDGAAAGGQHFAASYASVDERQASSDMPDTPRGLESPTARRLSRTHSMLLQMPTKAKRVRHRSCLGLPIISPFARWYQAWRWIILALDATYAAFLVPIHAAMQFEARTHTLFSGMDTVELVATVLYSIDILVQFNVAWIAVSEDLKQILVLDGKKIAKFYIRKGFFIDFVTTIPMVIELIIDLISDFTDELPAWVTSMSPWIRALRLLRFVRVFRICRLDFLTRITGRMDLISPSVSSLVMLVYFISFGVNLLGCMWYMIAWYGGIEDSWLSSKTILVHTGILPDGTPELDEIPLTEADFYAQLVASLYWTTTTVTTVGYGDITPANTFEMGVAIFVEFLGVLVFGLLIGILSSVFMNNSRQARSAQALQDRIQEANEWMVARHLPKNLRKTVRTFYTDVWQRQVMTHHDAKMLEDLPFALRSKVVLSIVKPSMEKSPQTMFRILPPSVQELLAASMVPITVCSGQDLIKEGRPTSHVWLLHSGEMAELHKLRVAALQIAPSFLGLLNLVQLILDGEEAVEKPSICGFRSIGMSNTWQIDLFDFAHVLDAFPRVRGPVMRSAINYLESCLMNPSPVEQWDRTAADLLDRLHSRCPQRSESGSGCSGSGGRLGDDPDMFGLDLPSHIEMLRKRELQIKVTNKMCSIIRQQQRRRQKRSALRLDLARSPWQRLMMFVMSGEYRKFFERPRQRRTSTDLLTHVDSRQSASSGLFIELPESSSCFEPAAGEITAIDAPTSAVPVRSNGSLTGHRVHFSRDYS